MKKAIILLCLVFGYFHLIRAQDLKQNNNITPDNSSIKTQIMLLPDECQKYHFVHCEVDCWIVWLTFTPNNTNIIAEDQTGEGKILSKVVGTYEITKIDDNYKYIECQGIYFKTLKYSIKNKKMIAYGINMYGKSFENESTN
jgi:hypothetical protein